MALLGSHIIGLHFLSKRALDKLDKLLCAHSTKKSIRTAVSGRQTHLVSLAYELGTYMLFRDGVFDDQPGKVIGYKSRRCMGSCGNNDCRYFHWAQIYLELSRSI